MKEKRNIHELIVKEAPSLNNLLDPNDVKEFKGVPKEWIVAPTFAGLDRCHRWSKDHEYLVVSSESMIYIAMIQLMLRRLAINST